jgi:lysophospholipase L1-like esterase
MTTARKTKTSSRSHVLWLATVLLIGACSDSSEPNHQIAEGPARGDDESPEVIRSDDQPGRRELDAGATRIDAGAKNPSPSLVRDGGDAAYAMSDLGLADLDAGVQRDDSGASPGQAAVETDAGKPDLTTPDASTPDASTPVLGGEDAGAGPRLDPGKGNGNDVVTIGDSWMSNTLQLTGTGGGIAPSLRSVSGQRYRNYAVQGVMLLDASLFGPAIPTQWDEAVRDSRDIKTVLMTGGGNDIIQNASLERDCSQGGQECEAVLEEIGQTLAALWKKMSEAGVRDIIHIAYAESAGDGLKNAAQNAARLQQLCDDVAPPARCHIFATDDLVKGDLVRDGIHPTRAANDRIATALYAFMEAERIRR